MVAAFLMLAMASHVTRQQTAVVFAQMRERRRRELLMLLLMGSNMPLTTQTRQKVERSPNGWRSSTMFGYVYGKDGVRNSDSAFKSNFRMSAPLFDLLCERLRTNAAYASLARNWERRNRGEKFSGKEPVPYEFRIASCLYLFAQGGNLKPTADVASVPKNTLREWLDDFCKAVVTELEPTYMPFEPACTSAGCDHTRPDCNLYKINRKFGARHGFPNVAAAVDGTHVRVNFGDPSYRNYKGWESILCVCFVSPFYTFTYADVGWSGRNGDTTVLKYSSFMEAVRADPVRWLGPGGVIVADGGCHDHDGLFMNPYFNPTTPQEFHFNFCQSSTRVFVEETFGRWKNRFRFLINPCDTEHELTSRMIYASMILHNFITVNSANSGLADSAFGIEVMAGGKTDTEIWAEFYSANEPDLCPACRRRNALHCVHMSEYQADVSRGRVGATRRTRDVIHQRNYLRDKFWRRLIGAEPDHEYSDASDDEEQTVAETLDRLLANNADRANVTELEAVVDKAHYNLMVTRALRGYTRPRG